MKCNVCGAENKEGAQFCHECGKALIDEPIKLELEQIKVPASSRKAHIIKVNATKKSEKEELPKEPENAENGGEYIDLSVPKAEQKAQTPYSEKAEEPVSPVTDPTEKPMQMRNWIPVFILRLIPCVNIVMLFVWAFSSKTNKSKKSYARVMLIFTLILSIISVALAFVYIYFFNPDLNVFKGI